MGITVRFKNCTYNLSDLSEAEKDLMKEEITKELEKGKKNIIKDIPVNNLKEAKKYKSLDEK